MQSADYELGHGNSNLWMWRFRLVKAEALLRLGKPASAIDLLLPDPSLLPPDVLARRKILQGQCLCQLNDFSAAADHLKEAAELAGSNRGILAEVFFSRGKCSVQQNQPDLAKEDFLRAEELAEKTNSFVQASAMGFSAVLLMRAERYDEAIDRFQTVLRLARSIQSPSLEQITLGNLGFCYAQLGDWKRAISFSGQAEQLTEQMQNKSGQERWLIDLGKAHYSLWELSEAESAYLKALPIAQALKDSASTASCLNSLARIALRRHDTDSAERYERQGEVLQVASERLHFALDGAEISAARQQWKAAEQGFSYVASSATADAPLRSFSQWKLGEVYWKEGKLDQADRMFKQGIETAEDAMRRIKDVERRMSFLDEERFYDSYIRFLAAQNRSTDALTVVERARAQVSVQESPRKNLWSIPASRFQASLQRDKQVVFAYWITDDESFLWAITRSKFQLFKLPGHLELHQLIDKYNEEIRAHNEIADSPAAEKLYQTLVQPAESLISKGSHVVVIPSKVLCWVDFEALVLQKPHPHYWIEDVDVQIADSLARMPGTESKSRREGTKETKDLLLLGAPVEASSDYPTLKHAPEEIQRVQAHFDAPQETIISGQAATPGAYRTANAGSYRFIHLDTHGTSSDRSPLDSAVILSPDGDATYKLYAREIKDIPLHADLVTISACYGAGTRWYNNEGVVGLGWAFLRAGARQVIAGLWEVDDASSPELMDDFYGELTQGKSAAEALRDAKLKMLHSSDFHRHPYYWASLQLYSGS